MSVLFQLIEEDIILKIMEQLHPSQWKLMSRKGFKDNLLHHFINENYILAIGICSVEQKKRFLSFVSSKMPLEIIQS